MLQTNKHIRRSICVHIDPDTHTFSFTFFVVQPVLDSIPIDFSTSQISVESVFDIQFRNRT